MRSASAACAVRDEDPAGLARAGLLEKLMPLAAGGEADDFEPLRQAGNHVEGGRANRPGRTEDGDAPAVAVSWGYNGDGSRQQGRRYLRREE